MGKVNNFTKKVIKGTVKVVLGIVIALMFLLGGTIIALQFPAVQTKAVNKAAAYLSDLIKFPVKIDEVNIKWFDVISLKGVLVEDPHKGRMIYLGEAKVDFSILSLMSAKVNVDKITLKNGRVNLIKYAPNGNLNIDDFISAIQDLIPPSSPTPKKTKPAPFTIDGVSLENMAFSYFDEMNESITEGFDYNHFILDSIYADASNMRIIADTFMVSVTNLRTVDKQSQLRVHKLDTDFMIAEHIMEFKNLNASIGESTVKNYLAFHFNDIQDDLTDFIDKVVLETQLDNSVISFADLSNFSSSLKSFYDKPRISGHFKGKVGSFTGTGFELHFGQGSSFKGRIHFIGLPYIDSTYLDFKFNNSFVKATDLKQYLPASAYEVLEWFTTIKGSGNFTGFFNDFLARGKFETGLGQVEPDIHLKINENKNPKSFYKGHLITHNFNLGKLVGYPDEIQMVDIDGNIKGEGFTLEDAHINLDATIHRLGLNNYDYQNIVINADLSERMFNGKISARDSNLTFVANGMVDLREGKDIFDIKAKFDRANLKPLHITELETLVKTEMDLNFKGLKPDDIVGEAQFTNTYLVYEGNKEIFIDSLYASSRKDSTSRNFKLESDLASIDAKGNFEFSGFARDISTLYKEYLLSIENNTEAIASYYQTKIHYNEKYGIDFNIHLKNINALLAIYTPGLVLSKGVFIDGSYKEGYTSMLDFHTSFDTIYYKEDAFFKSDIDFHSSKPSDSSDILMTVNVNSRDQKLNTLPETEYFAADAVWHNNKILFNSKVSEKGNSNKITLHGQLSFLDNIKLLELNNSSINLLNKSWAVADSNKIYFTKNEISFENVQISNGPQVLALNGTISDQQDKEASLEITNFLVQTINPLLAHDKIEGTLNAKIKIRDLYKDLDLSGGITLNKFVLNKFLIGDIHGTAGWDNTKNQLGIDVDVNRLGNKIISLDGYMKPNASTKTTDLNFLAELDDANLEILSPILSGILSDVTGTVTGDLQLTGTTKAPVIKGVGEIENGTFKVDYLGSTFTLNDKIYLDQNLIGFKKLALKDDKGNTAIINGGIYHDNFDNFVVNVKGLLKNTHLLHTTEKDNDMFYGDAFVSGNFEMLGAFSNLKITATATSNKNTEIFIPLNSYEGVSKQSYITFVSRKDVKKLINSDSVDLSGISLDLNLEITPDAYSEIIFDKKSGDIIRGNGEGNLRLVIDTRGDFNMYGNYRIVKGAYNFTLAGLINKEFSIEPSSSISWTGDPYAGTLDIKAIYKEYVSLKPLVDTNTARQMGSYKYPVNVLLGLQGNLMSPQVSLGIDIVKYPNVAAEAVTEFNSLIKSNEQELNRQVFSLLILKNFSPQGSFTGISNSGSNISELLSNQLSNWLSQVDNNLQVDIDLNSLDKQALNTFQLRMSYTLLDGRLRISRDGGFTNVQTTSQASNVTNIAGEWTLEYLLSKNGTFRMKLYNKNNQNPLLTSLVNTYNTSAGFSLLHTQSFNNLNDLFKKKEERKKKKTEEDDEQKKMKDEEDQKKNSKKANIQDHANKDIHRKEDAQEENNE